MRSRWASPPLSFICNRHCQLITLSLIRTVGDTIAGLHTISIQVLRWSDGSYLECQDTWRLSGIQRHCWLYATSRQLAICDYHVATDVMFADDGASDDGATWTAALSIDVRLEGEWANEPSRLAGCSVRASLRGPFIHAEYDSPPRAGLPTVWTETVSPSRAEGARRHAAEPQGHSGAHIGGSAGSRGGRGVGEGSRNVNGGGNAQETDEDRVPRGAADARECAGNRSPCSDREVRADEDKLLSGSVEASFRTVIETPALWSAEEPYL